MSDTPDRLRHERIQRLVLEALGKPADERARILDQACGDDLQLRREVETFLDASDGTELNDRDAGDLRESVQRASAWEALIAQLHSRGPTYRRYVFKGEIARGGMGVVHRVFDQDARRTLALKVMLGQGNVAATGQTPSVEDASLGRFLEEAQVTSQLDHPGIVPVHELGVDGDGRVYFTMKLVKGDDLRAVFKRIADRHDTEWTTTRALNVVLRVCEAMAYAHEKGVIHRDLKPGNVMVGKFGEAYVMDWGLARVLGKDDPRDLRIRDDVAAIGATSALRSDRAEAAAATPDSPILTMDGAVVGTPAYMPPEQARGRVAEIGAAADVYAVGAMLYHLLAGRMPYTGPGDRLSPRTILALVIQAPPAPVASLAPNTPLELVAIVEKAMARDIADRYPDMTALADDLRAFLENRVVRAHRTGALIELKKWVGRNRLTAAALSAVLVSLLGGAAAFAAVQRENAESERRLGEEVAAEKALAVTALQNEQGALARMRDEMARATQELQTRRRTVSLLQSLFRAPQPSRALGREVTAREVLEVARAELATGEVTEPVVLGQLQVTLAWTYKSLGDYESSYELYVAGIENLESELGPAHEDVLMNKGSLGQTLSGLDRLEEAIALDREVLRVAEASHGPDSGQTIRAKCNLGARLRTDGQFVEGGALLEDAYLMAVEAHGSESALAMSIGKSLLPSLAKAERFDEAIELATAILEHQEGGEGELTPELLYSMDDLGNVLNDLGRHEEAETMIRASFDGMMKVLGPDHPDTYFASYNLGNVYLQSGRIDEACEQFELTVLNRERLLGPSHNRTLRTRNQLAIAYRAAGQLDEASALYILNHDLAVAHGSAEDTLFMTKNGLANLHLDRGEFERALELFEECRAGYRRIGASWTDRARSIRNVIVTLIRLDDLDEAESLLVELFEVVPAEHHAAQDAFLRAVEGDGLEIPPGLRPDERR